MECPSNGAVKAWPSSDRKSAADSTATCRSLCAAHSDGMSTPGGVKKSRRSSPGAISPATGKNPKMPPPELFTTTTVTGGCPGRSRRRRSPLASWRNETSPTRRNTGRPSPAAKPLAELTRPSMPLAPRLLPTGTRDPPARVPRIGPSANMSTSRIGIEFPRYRPVPGGSAAHTARATLHSVKPLSEASAMANHRAKASSIATSRRR
mmetsp:Transcript_5069/g.17624  ORF Transcript_5069/g.17624 Transcript_5069/m.17624 type:complete len:207 (+) Transcript_5069:4795-5415(+)